MLLHGGEETFKASKEICEDLCRAELRNTFEFMEMTVAEKQRELWRRNKFSYENLNEKYVKNNPSFEFPYIHWPNFL